MATTADLLDLIPGAKIVVSSCEAREHGDNSGCLCAYKGRFMIAGKRYQTSLAGTPSWYIAETDKTFRLSEVTFITE